MFIPTMREFELARALDKLYRYLARFPVEKDKELSGLMREASAVRAKSFGRGELKHGKRAT